MLDIWDNYNKLYGSTRKFYGGEGLTTTTWDSTSVRDLTVELRMMMQSNVRCFPESGSFTRMVFANIYKGVYAVLDWNIKV